LMGLAMSEVLIVDNRPKGDESDRIMRIREVVEAFDGARAKVVHFNDLEETETAEAIVLSGSAYNVSHFDESGERTWRETHAGGDFQPEIEIIARPPCPILAISFGHTLVAKTYGGHVLRNEHSSEWRRAIGISVEEDELLQGDYVVDVMHRDYVPPDDRIQEHFHVRSISADTADNRRYVQYMRHRSLPIYSVQFHPEAHVVSPDNYMVARDVFSQAKHDGERIIRAFLELALSD